MAMELIERMPNRCRPVWTGLNCTIIFRLIRWTGGPLLSAYWEQKNDAKDDGKDQRGDYFWLVSVYTDRVYRLGIPFEYRILVVDALC